MDNSRFSINNRFSIDNRSADDLFSIVEGSKKVEARIFYNSASITWNFFQENPDIAGVYPSKEQIEAAIKTLKDKTAEGYLSILEITENETNEIINSKRI